MTNSIFTKRIINERSKNFKFAVSILPEKYKGPITTLYAFVRTYDDLVDQSPPYIESYFKLKKGFYNTLQEKKHVNPVITEFVKLMQKYNLELELIEAFFESMEMDINQIEYNNWEELEKYMYGSAGIVGIICAKIFGAGKKETLNEAAQLGYAFQIINFARDVQFDITELGRNYIPSKVMDKYSINSSQLKQVRRSKEYHYVIKEMIKKYEEYLLNSEMGLNVLHNISLRVSLAVTTAILLYNWTAESIKKSPDMIKYSHRPSKITMIALFLKATLMVLRKNYTFRVSK